MSFRATDWVHFKKTFSKEQEDAIWQYLIDHAKVQPNGFLGMQLYVRDVDDFWRRVYARYSGDFKRYDRLEKEKTQQSTALFVMQAMSRRNEAITRRIDREGSLQEKVILWLNRKTRQSLFGGRVKKVKEVLTVPA